MENHHFLFKFQDPDGYVRIINLDALCHVSIEPRDLPPDEICYWAYLLDGESVLLTPNDGERLLDAWNAFLKVKTATHYVLPEVEHFGVTQSSVERGLRIEKLVLEAIQESHILNGQIVDEVAHGN